MTVGSKRCWHPPGSEQLRFGDSWHFRGGANPEGHSTGQHNAIRCAHRPSADMVRSTRWIGVLTLEGMLRD